MSGSPKKTLAQINAERRQKLLDDALKLAELERQRVAEAQRQAQLQQLINSRKEVEKGAVSVTSKCVNVKNASAKVGFDKECSDFKSKLQSARNIEDVNSLIMKLNKLSQQIDDVIRNESITEKKEKLTQDIKSAQEQLSKISAKRSEKYNPGCRKQLDEQLKSLSGSLNSANVEQLGSQIAASINDVSRHVETVNTTYLSCKTEAESALLNMQTRLDNLKEDYVTSKWHHPRINEKQKEIQRIQQQFADENFDDIPNQVANIDSYIDALIKEAVDLDVKAQERDYIAESIRKSLADMGFSISSVVQEHKGHPKTRLLFQAKKNTGEGINIGVPYEGNVEYDVGGYPMHTESKVGGGAAKACDKAEEMLKEMHKNLDQKYGVKAGKITWDGQDPDRVLKRAEQLPDSADTSRRNSRE